jgi:hypothetical protein
MYRILVAVVGLGMLAVSVPAAALGLGEAGELEAARANARAGGPISGRDAELLERYGCQAAPASRGRARRPFPATERIAPSASDSSVAVGTIDISDGAKTERKCLPISSFPHLAIWRNERAYCPDFALRDEIGCHRG